MIWLALCIVSSATIFYVFKSIGKNNIPALPVIVINYFIASFIGFLIGGKGFSLTRFINSEWFLLALIIGVLFILMFFLIGISSREAGISSTTVASKMSVVIPIAFSIIADPSDKLTLVKLIGIFLAVVAVVMTVYRKKNSSLNTRAFLFPMVLFLGMGMVDSLVKFAQFRYVNNEELSYFTAILFFISFLTGLIVIVFIKSDRKALIHKKVLNWGIFLGIANFGSIFFLIRALNFVNAEGKGIDSSVVFGINNTSVVLLSVLAGLIIFHEKLSMLNRAGIILSIIAIIIFSVA